MSAVEVLFRDSSAADGVRSRGAGWHSRAARCLDSDQTGESLIRELAEGDLVRGCGKPPGLHVHDGQILRAVEPMGQEAQDHYSEASRELAERSLGDWPSFWEASRDATDLLWVVRHHYEQKELLAAAACDLAETVLRFVPEGERRPARALRVTRLWFVGTAAIEAVRSGSDDASAASLDLYSASAAAAARASSYASSFATYLSSFTYASFTARDATFATSSRADAAFSTSSRADAARSLAFLVRVRIPLWKPCLPREE